MSNAAAAALKDGAETPLEPRAPELPKGIVQVADRITMTDPEAFPMRTSEHRGWNAMYTEMVPHTVHHGLIVVTYAGGLVCRDAFTETDAKAFAERHLSYYTSCYGATVRVHLMATPDDCWPTYGLLYPDHLPWHRQAWFSSRLHILAEALPRYSTRFPGLVAYYQTPQKRRAEVLTPIKPGRFLKKFFGDVLTEEQIQEYSMEWIAATTPGKFEVTQDADEIEEVYVNGPTSCMSKDEDYFEGDCHPTRVYAGPDLGIAYIGDKDDAKGRAVVWPEKKIYGRMYGDIHRLEMAFEAAGWRQGADEEFTGARLRLIKSRGRYTVPYCDTHTYARDDGEFLVLGRGDVYLRNTEGYFGGSRFSCVACDDSLDEDDACYQDGEHYCQSCFDERFNYCSVNDDHYPAGEGYRGPGGTWISQEAVDDDRAFVCEATNRAYPTRGYDYVTVDGETWELSYAENHAFLCEFSDEWYRNEEHRELDDGRVFAWAAVNRWTADSFEDWRSDAREIGRIDHPRQLELDLALAA